MDQHRSKFGFAYEVCDRKCFSLGFHIDTTKHYLDLHVWNWYIHIGREESDIPKEIMEQVYELQDLCHEQCDELLKDYTILKI
jgi:hypothetical protein